MAIFVQLWSYLQIIQLLAKADNLVITQLFKGSSRIFQDQISFVFLSNTYILEFPPYIMIVKLVWQALPNGKICPCLCMNSSLYMFLVWCVVQYIMEQIFELCSQFESLRVRKKHKFFTFGNNDWKCTFSLQSSSNSIVR